MDLLQENQQRQQQQGMVLLLLHQSNSTISTVAATLSSSLMNATIFNPHQQSTISLDDHDDLEQQQQQGFQFHAQGQGGGSEEEECPLYYSSSSTSSSSRPSFAILDVIWNMGLVLVAAFVLLTSFFFTDRDRDSTPTTINPLRLWIAGYALQCLLHLSFLSLHHFHHLPFSTLLSRHQSFIRRVESINTVFSYVWWVFGFYWIYIGGQSLLQDSPRLYWCSVLFLALDVFFMIFCIAIVCIVFILMACCFPILARVAYAMTAGEGATEDDIRTLPKYRYCHPNAAVPTNCCRKQEEAGLLAHSDSNNIPDLALSSEDSECCICLHGYEDGVELCTLPCDHLFHYQCIRRWLRINATCPLCKFNILQGEMLV